MYSVRLRYSKDNVENININEQCTVQCLKEAIQHMIKVQPHSFDIRWKGKLLDDNLDKVTLEKLGMQSDSIIDIIEKPLHENQLNVIIQFGLERANLSAGSQETLLNAKNKIKNLFPHLTCEYDLFYKDQKLQNQEQRLLDFKIKSGDTLNVKLKIPMGGGLEKKLRMAQSIMSSQSYPDENHHQCFTHHQEKEHRNCKSGISSLKNIKPGEQQKSKVMKSSSIQPYTMHKNQMNGTNSKQKGIIKIQDINETMSFGSLESTKMEQFQVQVLSQDYAQYYRFACQYGCKVIQLKQKLAKMMRIKPQNVQFIEAKCDDLIEMLNQNDDSVQLTFRINN